jgi:hypothetical protein
MGMESYSNLTSERKQSLIADCVAARLRDYPITGIGSYGLPNWLMKILCRFQNDLGTPVFNQLYLKFLDKIPEGVVLEEVVSKNTYLVIILNHVLTSLSTLKQDKHVKESTLITKEVIEALKRNAGGKEMEALRKKAAANATNATANASAATANAANANANANAASAATAYAANAASAAYAATYAATYANAANAASAATAANAASWDETHKQTMTYFFESLISLIKPRSTT